MICQVRSLAFRFFQASMPRSGFSPSRVVPVGGTSRRYFPVSQPPPSGDQGSRPMPASSAAGTISCSMPRTSRLYCGCRVTGGSSRAAGEHDRLGELPAQEVREPVVPDLAQAVASSRNRSVSSRGVIGSQACSWYRSMCSTPSRRSESSSAGADAAGMFRGRSGRRPSEPALGRDHDLRPSAGRAVSHRPMISSGRPPRTRPPCP